MRLEETDFTIGPIFDRKVKSKKRGHVLNYTPRSILLEKEARALYSEDYPISQ